MKFEDLQKIVTAVSPAQFTNANQGMTHITEAMEIQFRRTFSPRLVGLLLAEVVAARESFYMCQVGHYNNYDKAREALESELSNE
jgi:hypothetical protein